MPQTYAARAKLAQTHPDLAAQWHPEKNGSLSPETVTPGSGKKVWWLCELGHSYDATVGNRVARGSGCPFCAGKQAWPGYNDLATTHPTLIPEWHPTKNEDVTPQDVTAGSNKKRWWMCAEGHEWQSQVNARSDGSGCPFCSGRYAVTSVNDLATTHPDVAAQWHATKNGDMTPSDVTAGSGRKVWWTCEEGHDWVADICGRTDRSRGCPRCANRPLILVQHGPLSGNALLSDQWHPTKNINLTPDDVTERSLQKVWWRCNLGHEWNSVVGSRFGKNPMCPFCAGRKLLIGFNDLATVSPEIAQEWHPTLNGDLTPDMFTSGSEQKVWWKCDKGHEWKTWIYARRSGNGCIWCSNRNPRGEREIAEVLETLGIAFERHRRNLLSPTLELDFYIADKNFAIEYNGVYWHSEQYKSKDYHLKKMQACEEVGITLYQIWEDDWNARRDVVIRGLAHRLGVADKLHLVLPDMPTYYAERIGARQTKAVTMDSKQAVDFLDAHHIQGAVVGSHYLGLEDKQGRIRAVLVLTKTGKPGELRIDRYASAGVVAGGFTKLLKHGEATLAPSIWITFADRAISTGGLYEDTGFHVDKVLKPDYSYLVKTKRVHKFNYRIARFQSDPDLIFEEGKTETELAAMNGLVRIWDSGKNRYVKYVS